MRRAARRRSATRRVVVDVHGSAAAAAIPASSESRLAATPSAGAAGVSRPWRRRPERVAGEVAGELLDRLDPLEAGQACRHFGVVCVEVVAGAACVAGVEVRQVERACSRVAIDQQVGVRDLDAGEVVHLVRLAEQHHAPWQRRARRPRPRVRHRWLVRPPLVARRGAPGEKFCWNRRGSGSRLGVVESALVGDHCHVDPPAGLVVAGTVACLG